MERPSVLLAGVGCVAMETPVEQGFYEPFSFPATTWDLFITEKASIIFHPGVVVVNQSEGPADNNRLSIHERVRGMHVQRPRSRQNGRRVNVKTQFVHRWRCRHSGSLVRWAGGGGAPHS